MPTIILTRERLSMPAFLVSLDPRTATVSLDKVIVLVGRHADCDVVFANSKKVSRKHCCFAQVNDRWMVRDLGSTNGVAVNGVRITGTQKLRLGDEILIGDLRFRLHHRPQLPAPDSAIISTGREPSTRSGVPPLSRISTDMPLSFNDESHAADPPLPPSGEYSLLPDRPPRPDLPKR